MVLGFLVARMPPLLLTAVRRDAVHGSTAGGCGEGGGTLRSTAAATATRGRYDV